MTPAPIQPLLHVGFHKTGTTWLQRRFFGTSSTAGFRACARKSDAKRELVLPHDLEFDPGKARAFFQPRIERIAAEGLVPVVSAERLCGDMLYGAYDSAVLADRLAAVFPDGRVLIVVREQRQMLFSSYQEYVAMGGRLALDAYLRRPKHAHPWPCDLRHFAYDRLIARYQRLLGAENVLALPYELFQREPRDFVARIVEFAGATPEPGALEDLQFDAVVNRSWPAQTIAAKRHANVVLRGRLNPWAPIDERKDLGRTLTLLLIRGTRRLPGLFEQRTRASMARTIQEVVGNRYRESNARTARLIGIDLGRYGYDVPEPARDGEGAGRPTVRAA